MVTPSLVIVGTPNFLSRTTLRPRGPSVTLTASASLSTPRSRERRASSLNLMILAMPDLSEELQGTNDDRPGDPGVRVAGAVRWRAGSAASQGLGPRGAWAGGRRGPSWGPATSPRRRAGRGRTARGSPRRRSAPRYRR